MNTNWPKCYAKMLEHEGGFVNHPKDPGGMTNLGVTKRVWEEYVGKVVTEKDMRALTAATVEPLYKRNYWTRIAGDELPSGVDFVVFDYGVNSGTFRAVTTLQRLVKASVDGQIGPKTLAAVKAYCDEKGAKALIQDYCDTRLSFLRGLGTWGTFGKGWARRVAETEEFAVRLLNA